MVIFELFWDHIWQNLANMSRIRPTSFYPIQSRIPNIFELLLVEFEIRPSLVDFRAVVFNLLDARNPLEKKTKFGETFTGMTYTKAALRRAFYAYVYCMWLHFQSNYVGWLKPR